jgi:hypothetical protein
LDNLKEFEVREPANFLARNNVGSAFATLSVKSMATRAIQSKGLLRRGSVRRSPGLRGRSFAALAEAHCPASQQWGECDPDCLDKNARVPNDRLLSKKSLLTFA